MNPALQYILESAMAYKKPNEMRHAALDEIFTKLVVRPIQMAWIRSRKNGYRPSVCC